MEKIKYYIEKYRLIIIIILAIILVLISILLSINYNKKENIDNLEIVEEKKVEEKEEIIEIAKYKVDIKGMVEKPGVYELEEGSRVIDVINKAGGLKENSNTEYLNLSKKIVDEMVIIIYSNEQVDKFKNEDKQIIYVEYECVCPDNKNDACINKEDTVNTNGIKDNQDNNSDNKENSDNKDNLVSINTGSLEELMTLTGIGESKAKLIIEYREKNGLFENLEDIMNVSGIGEKAYSKIKDSIKL